MALTERNRNALFQGLTRTIGDEEAVGAMLSQFPSGDEELATKSFVLAVEARIETRFAEQTRDLMQYRHTEMRRWFLWSYGAMFLLLAAVVTTAKILG